MSKDDLELVHGSGNVFRDLDHPNPEVEQLKAILAAKIIAVLDDAGISVRRAHELTGFAAADFSRVRQARLSRFTIDRLMAMLSKLDQDVAVSVTVKSRRQHATRRGWRDDPRREAIAVYPTKRPTTRHRARVPKR
jgi:predicted XRE-type DNA-binding protein